MLQLNFVYGELSGDTRFIPIDGQQRLTTLFLLYWYVFKRQGDKANNNLEILRRFAYDTRETSKVFCEKMIGHFTFPTDFQNNPNFVLSERIKKCTWFTGDCEADPTVDSMLVMMDEIHKKFQNDDMETLAEKLLRSGEDKIGNAVCPITFLWIPMENFNQSEDLYIKMNARGKQLSDFEIFKAKLQGSHFGEEEKIIDAVIAELNNDFEVASDNDKLQEVVKHISRYNNEYAEMFYLLLRKALKSDQETSHLSYDDGLMQFISTMVRDDYFCLIHENGINTKIYRKKYYTGITTLSGSGLFELLRTGSLETEKQSPNFGIDRQTVKACLISSLVKIYRLLEIFTQSTDDACSAYYSDDLLLRNSFGKMKNINNSTFDEFSFPYAVARYMLYEYLFKLGHYPNSEEQKAYCALKRFTYNLFSNSDVDSADDVVQAMVCFKSFAGGLVGLNEERILEQIRDFSSSTPAVVELQLKEEKKKAELMLISPEWKKAILEAEGYYKDGKIGFLIPPDEQNASLDNFLKCFNCSKSIFDETYRIKDDDLQHAFERLLLCCEFDLTPQRGHLKEEAHTWRFILDGSYKTLLGNEAFIKIVYNILSSVVNNNCTDKKDIIDTLNSLREEKYQTHADEIDGWKKLFIEDDLFGTYIGRDRTNESVSFSRGALAFDDNNKVLLLCQTSTRSWNMELKTLVLYQAVQREYDVTLHSYRTIDTYSGNDDRFPARYIAYGNCKIGYIPEQNQFVYQHADPDFIGRIEELISQKFGMLELKEYSE